MIDGENYRHIRSEFEAINKQDKTALRQWFEKYSHLSNNQLARLTKRSNWTIRDYKSKVGLGGFSPKHRPRNLNWSITTSLPTTISRDITNEELETLLQNYSMNQISKAMGISVVALYNKIKRRNIKYRKKSQTDVSKNPCCNYAWLYENYFIKYRSCSKCAKLAGVYPQTISSWLIKHNIPLLTKKGGVVWLSDTLRILEQEPMVKWVKVNNTKVKINYSGFIENYYFNRVYGIPGNKGRHFNINEREFIIRKEPKVNFKYYSEDITKPNDTVYSLNRREFEEYNLIEKRLAIHRFMHKLTERGYKRLELPEDEIAESVHAIHNIDGKAYRFKGGYLSATPRYNNQAGKKLILTHYDMKEFYRGIYNSKTVCHKRLKHLISKKTLFDIDEISLQLNYPNPKWFDYMLLAEIMRDLKLNRGPILDISPVDRYISITASRLGVPILYPSLDQHRDAIDRGYFDKLKVQYGQHVSETVETIVAIYFDRYPEIEVMKKYLKYGKKLIIIPRLRDIAEWTKSLPPKNVITYRRHPTINREQPIFVY